MAKYYYEREIENKYLGYYKIIKGNSASEVHQKAEYQLAKWKEQERKARERERFYDLKIKAELDSIEAQKHINEYRELLAATLGKDDRIQWSSLMNNDEFPPFRFNELEPLSDSYVLQEPYPDIKLFYRHYNVPEENWFLLNVPILKTYYLKKVQKAREMFDSAVREYEGKKQELKSKYEKDLQGYLDRKESAFKQYEVEKTEFENKKAVQNKEIVEFKQLFEKNDEAAVTQYIELVLDRSSYPEDLIRSYDISYDALIGTAVIEYRLPNTNEIPSITGYKYIASRKTIEPIQMKSKEFNTFYEDVIFQITLRTIHEIFESVYIKELQAVVFNGWVEGIDPSTGHDFTSCVISVQVTRETFESINLHRVTPKECIRSFKGLTAGALVQMAPVKPIMQLNKADNRFVESKEILAEMNDSDNLAEMPWEDFEHLIRELFSKIFSSNGGEVNVTRASRDGGVDAIAFDPDPIRGGKFVIQAKRYNNVVGLSAVRDLYGTMINEGAVKGILVTTSYFGNDSREFVKDKPITLIDGANLLHLFNQQGYNVRIDLKSKGV